MNERNSVKLLFSPEGKTGGDSYYKEEILKRLDGQPKTVSQLREEMGIEVGTREMWKMSQVFTRLEAQEGHHNKMPVIKVAIKAESEYKDTFYYYRVDQEEELIEKGVISATSRRQKGLSGVSKEWLSKYFGS